MSKKHKFTAPASDAQLIFRGKLKGLKQAVKAAQEAYSEAKKKCLHTIEYSYEIWKWGGHESKDGHTWCADCGEDFGHYCPDSPDHACHYFSEDGLHVKLFTGEIVRKKLDEYDPDNIWDNIVTVNNDCMRYETDDTCLFCGAPQERK